MQHEEIVSRGKKKIPDDKSIHECQIQVLCEKKKVRVETRDCWENAAVGITKKLSPSQGKKRVNVG